MATEREREEELLLVLWLLLGRLQREAARGYSPVLLKAMVGLRRLVMQMQEDGIFRVYEWERLKVQIPGIIAPLEDELRRLIPEVMRGASGRSRTAAAAYAQTPERSEPEAESDDALLNSTVVAGIVLALELNGRFSRKVADDLDRLVRYRLSRGEPTSAIAEHVAATTTKKGKKVVTMKKGSWANGIRNRMRNMNQAAIWAQITREVELAWEDAGALEWEWLANLELRNCPICRALHGQRRPTADGFGYMPPVHPNCACVILPRRMKKPPREVAIDG